VFRKTGEQSKQKQEHAMPHQAAVAGFHAVTPYVVGDGEGFA
jgi:hypothetical protein